MGEACFCLITDLESSDWISLIGILINAFLAYWIVKTIQNNLTNKRVLKDHFIKEIIEIRGEIKACLNNIYFGKISAKSLLPWFKLMYIKIEDLMNFLDHKYGIDKKILSPYQIELRELITNHQEFIKQFEKNKPLNFSDEAKNTIVIFQQTHSQLFNNLIILVNDAE